MKIYKTVEVPAKAATTQQLNKRVCDLCGFSAKGEDWGAGFYEVNETEVRVEVRHKEGSSYPEGGDGTEYDIDICPSCFVNKLVPWVEEEGDTEIERKDWDW